MFTSTRCHWADLSRPVGNLIRWLMEFYQLLFQLCMVGRKSLEFACAKHQLAARNERPRWAWLWSVFGWSQLIAEQALALAVPILGFYLLALCVAVSPLFLKPESLVPVILGGALQESPQSPLALGVYFLRRLVFLEGADLAFSAVAAAGGGGRSLCWCYLRNITSETATTTALVHAVWLAWGVSVAGILALMFSHQKTRKGAFPLALIIGGLVGICGSGPGLCPGRGHKGTSEGIFSAVVRTADLTAWILLAAWIVVIVFAAVATLAGFFHRPGSARESGAQLSSSPRSGAPSGMDDEPHPGPAGADGPYSQLEPVAGVNRRFCSWISKPCGVRGNVIRRGVTFGRHL